MKEIAKNYNAQDFEQQIYKKWEESGYFNPDNLNTIKKKHFSISLPPPNATGVLHLGHAAMLAYQDTMIRYHRMLGEKTLWLPGTDHAAIATQNVVERKIAKEENKTKEDLGREEFLNRIKQYVADSQDTIRNQLRRMGSSLDWDRERYTFSDSLSQCVNMTFKKMYDDGLIYRGYRIVNWCPGCYSTLSDDEVKYKEQQGKLYYLKYGPVEIATTRPETKIGDTGLAVHPDDKRYQKYIGQTLEFELGDIKLKVKVIADKEVDPEFGTGAIGVTPAHSALDYEWAQKNDLEVKKVIDEDGKMTKEAGKYEGLTVEEARKEFLQAIKDKGQLVREEDYTNNLSICYRCRATIEPLTSEQWFVNVNKKIPGKGKSLKEMSVEAVKHGLHGKQIEIIPKKFVKVYYHWMENLHDWCISRQIWWGHRIPVWYKITSDKIPSYASTYAKASADKKASVFDSDPSATSSHSSLSNEAVRPQSRTAGPSGAQTRGAGRQDTNNDQVTNSKLQDIIVPKTITEIVLSRHGLTDWNQAGIVQGITDVPLDENRMHEIEAVAKKFKKEDFDLIMHSPLMRSRQTAEIINKELNLSLVEDELLIERNYGSFEGRKVADLKKEYPDYYKDKINFDIPGDEDEPYEQMAIRVEKFLAKVDKKYNGKKILVISHNAVMRTFEMVTKDTNVKELSNYKPIFGELVRYYILDGNYKLKDYMQDEDTLDTWFSSALWTFSTLLDQDFKKYSSWEEWIKNSPDLKRFHPTSVMETGYDILFFWVARMILMTTYILDEVPFETVYLHGLIRDKQGRKMSKSLGNGIDPIDMIDKFGADALRLSMLVGATPGNDIRLFEEKIEGYRNFVNKLWNISRYILGSVKDIRVIKERPKAMTLADKWILSELQQLIDEVTADLDNFRFSSAITKLYHFTWGDFADWYIEISKIEIGKGEILLYVLQQLLKLWHPFAPFVTEVIWENFDDGLLMVNLWPAKSSKFIRLFKKNKSGEFSLVKDVISIIRNAKATNKVDPVKLLNCQIIGKERLMADNKAVIEKLARIKFVSNKADNWLELHANGIDIAINIDKAEAAKMQAKKKEELEKYVTVLEKKLNNGSFVKNAPAEVIEQEKAKLAEAEEKLSKLK